MPYRVVGIVDAAFYRLITHVDSITTRFRDGGIPGNRTFQTGIVDGARLPGRASHKGILFFLIAAFVEGKTRDIGGMPVEDTFTLFIARTVGGLFGVVVDNGLMILPVTFTGGEHDGACFLQHRDEVGGDDGLCEQILTGAEEGRTLPAPHMIFQIIIAPVAGPDREVTVLQTTRNLIG